MISFRCKGCGYKIQKNSLYCMRCGLKVEDKVDSNDESYIEIVDGNVDSQKDVEQQQKSTIK